MTEEELKGMDAEEIKQAEADIKKELEVVKKWKWMQYFYSLAKGDIMKMSDVTKMNFIFCMNFKSYESENPDVKNYYGNFR